MNLKQQIEIRERERGIEGVKLRPLCRNVTSQNLFHVLWVSGVQPDTWTKRQKAEDVCLRLV